MSPKVIIVDILASYRVHVVAQSSRWAISRIEFSRYERNIKIKVRVGENILESFDGFVDVVTSGGEAGVEGVLRGGVVCSNTDFYTFVGAAGRKHVFCSVDG